MKSLQVFLLDPKAIAPTRNLSTDAGADLYALEDTFIPIGQTTLVKTGVAIKVPEGKVGLLRERSSIGKKGMKVAGGVIDAGYSGDCSILLMNVSCDANGNRLGGGAIQLGYQVRAGERIAQVIITTADTQPIEVVDTLWTSERGNKGFGSSGV